MRSKSMMNVMAGCVAVTALLMSGGCGVAYYNSSQQMMQHYTAHDLDAALAIAERHTNARTEPAADKDQLAWCLEKASLLRARGDIEASDEVFDFADLVIETYDEQAEVRVSSEAAATMSNLAALPYRGYAYDRIMVSTYRALNAMKLGDFESARVELNRAMDRQQRAVERNQQRIAAAEEEASEAKEKGYVMKEESRPEALDELENLDIQFAELYRAQGDYVNPFTEFLQALYFLHAGHGASDMENGRHAFGRVAAMVGDHNVYVLDDLEMANDLIAGRGAPQVTYVIFETGRAPSRDQIKIDIPLPIAGVDYVGAAFPKLVFHHNHEPYLLVEHGGGTLETRLLSDMDTIIGLEFKNDLPVVITRTIMIAAAQAAMHYGLHLATQGDDWVNIMVRVSSAVYRYAQAQADRRTWLTLPKQFQYCRLATPPDRAIVLRTPGGHEVPVTVEPGEVNVVYVKSILIGAPLEVWQFQLR